MKFGIATSLVFISLRLLSQYPVAAVEGAYASYQQFVDGDVAMGIDSVEKCLQENVGGNVLTFPLASFDEWWGVFYKGHLFVRGNNVQCNKLRSGLAPSGTILTVMARWNAGFARIIRFGKICLTAENKLVKLPGSRGHEFSTSSFRNLIRDDVVLFDKFNRERNKRLSIYKYIDLYNQRHVLVNDPAISSRD